MEIKWVLEFCTVEKKFFFLWKKRIIIVFFFSFLCYKNELIKSILLIFCKKKRLVPLRTKC